MVFSGKLIKNTITALFAVFPLLSMANVSDDVQQGHAETETHATEASHTETHEPADKKTKIKAFIEHHLQDSHDFVFFSDEETGEHYGFSLPVILLDEGLKIFSSSKFHHGEEVAEVDGKYY